MGTGVQHISITYMVNTQAAKSESCASCAVNAELYSGEPVNMGLVSEHRAQAGPSQHWENLGVACSVAGLCLGWLNGNMAPTSSFSLPSLL